MIASSVRRILGEVADDAFVLDVGGWGKPFRRADVVLDQMPYETRGLYGFDGEGRERFDEMSWVRLDVCDRTPWPFADDTFDFVICSHTLEDLRDPVWVCSEMARVGKAGYVEVPSRLEEQCFGIQGPWVGWGHHHWLVDMAAPADPDHPGWTAGRWACPPGVAPDIEFVFKHHVVHGMHGAHFPAGFHSHLSEDERVQSLWWRGGFSARERTFVDAEGLDAYLATYVAAEMQRRGLPPPGSAGPVTSGSGPARRVAARLRRAAHHRLHRPSQVAAGRPASAASTGIPEGVGS